MLNRDSLISAKKERKGGWEGKRRGRESRAWREIISVVDQEKPRLLLASIIEQPVT